MPQIEYVTGTAFVVAEFRAEENREAEPLYQDHIVELFLNGDTRAAAGRVSTNFPSAKDLVRIKKPVPGRHARPPTPLRRQAGSHSRRRAGPSAP